MSLLNDKGELIMSKLKVGIIDHFFDSVKHGVSQSPSARDSLKTHQICEQIVLKIEQQI